MNGRCTALRTLLHVWTATGALRSPSTRKLSYLLSQRISILFQMFWRFLSLTQYSVHSHWSVLNNYYNVNNLKDLTGTFRYLLSQRISIFFQMFWRFLSLTQHSVHSHWPVVNYYYNVNNLKDLTWILLVLSILEPLVYEWYFCYCCFYVVSAYFYCDFRAYRG